MNTSTNKRQQKRIEDFPVQVDVVPGVLKLMVESGVCKTEEDAHRFVLQCLNSGRFASAKLRRLQKTQ